MFVSKASFKRIKLHFDKYYRFKITDHVVYSRTSTITSNLIGSSVIVYKGNGWVKVKVSR